jgi:hypothetical protein
LKEGTLEKIYNYTCHEKHEHMHALLPCMQLIEDTHDLGRVLHAAFITSPPPLGGCSQEDPEPGTSLAQATSQLEASAQHSSALQTLLGSAGNVPVSFGSGMRPPQTPGSSAANRLFL